MADGAHVLDFGGEPIVFAVMHTSRRKTVSISVGYDGIRVLAPAELDDDHVVGVVRKKAPWILRKQAAYRELGGPPIEREFVSGETFYYLGRAYRLKVVADSSAVVTRIKSKGPNLLAPTPRELEPTLKRAAIKSGLRQWYCGRAKQHFPRRAAILAAKIGIVPPPVRIVDQSKRWGSCDARGRIRLNWRLVMAPTSLIDYVIAHELCHVLEHSHSRQFWRSLEVIMPDYEERVRKIDRLGHLFVW